MISRNNMQAGSCVQIVNGKINWKIFWKWGAEYDGRKRCKEISWIKGVSQKTELKRMLWNFFKNGYWQTCRPVSGSSPDVPISITGRMTTLRKDDIVLTDGTQRRSEEERKRWRHLTLTLVKFHVHPSEAIKLSDGLLECAWNRES